MSSEYDKLYSLLENLIITHQPETQLEPVSFSVEVTDTSPTKKKGPGRPPGSKNIEKLQCIACLQKFHPKYMKQYETHCITSVACKKFIALAEQPPILKAPIHQLIIDTLEKATSTGIACRFCEQTINDMKEHMTTSHVCNRMAYQEFKKLF
jgi:hypothetical protein